MFETSAHLGNMALEVILTILTVPSILYLFPVPQKSTFLLTDNESMLKPVIMGCQKADPHDEDGTA
jgi:hypothetical protein